MKDNFNILQHLKSPPYNIPSISRILNLAMNRLDSLPRGFGSFPVLEVLDLSYNSLNDESMPGNFWIIHSLRALYLRYVFKTFEEQYNK